MSIRKVGNGSVVMPLIGSQGFRVFGGPYRQRPSDMVGVKMAEEIKAPCDVSIPTRDYQVPDTDVLNEGLNAAINCMLRGRTLYVGCMGGMGRTGLFLAVLAKAMGVPNPVKFVRENYYSHAVETNGQYDFVTQYEVPMKIKMKLAVARKLFLFFPHRLEKA